jgi:hypothetical protein
MQLKKATRKQVKLRMGLAAPAGAGKTYSALVLAHGITNDWNKIAVIDTENGSASLYAHLGEFNTIEISAPYAPEKYIDAIKACEDAGMEVIIIDSISQEWSGVGGCLDIHEQEVQKQKISNSFTAWASVTPRHQRFVDSILQSKCHVVTTVRSKTEYVLAEKNGRNVPQKVGMAAITRDGFEFELTLSFDIDINHMAQASKDRTGLFMDKPKFPITADTGKKILEWCNSGTPLPKPSEHFLKLVEDAKDVLSADEQDAMTKGCEGWTTEKLREEYKAAQKVIAEKRKGVAA